MQFIFNHNMWKISMGPSINQCLFPFESVERLFPGSDEVCLGSFRTNFPFCCCIPHFCALSDLTQKPFYLYFDSWQAILTMPMLEGHFSPKNSKKYISSIGVIFRETNKLKHETVGISSKKMDKKFCIIMRLV